MKRMAAVLWAAGLLVAQTVGAQAAVVFSASGTNTSNGSFLAASASFDVLNHGTELQLTLSNLGGPVHDPSDILTAVFFNLSDVGTLTPVSAVLGPNSVLLNGPLSSGKTLGDNWEYLGNLSNIPGGVTRGISSAGLGIFGQGNFGTKGQNVGGAPYGIINGTGANGHGQIPSMQLENNSVVFTLSGLPADFQFSDITSVEFQFGTSLAPSEPMLISTLVVPEPSSLALVALGSAALLALRRRQP